MNTRAEPSDPPLKPVRHYLTVLAVMLILLGISLGSAFLPLGPFHTVINVSIAVIMAVILITVYMHETSTHMTWIASAAGFAWLALLFFLSLVDYLTRVPIPPPWR